MAWIEPFKGFRPPKEIADKVACPPYDILNSKEAREMAAGHQLGAIVIGVYDCNGSIADKGR